MKRKTQKQKKEEKERLVTKYNEQLQQLLKQTEAGNQTFAALTEIENILTRMAELKDKGMMDSPEFKQLEQRYDMLNGFKDRQSMLFKGMMTHF